MNPALFRKALRNGQTVYGTLVVSPSPRYVATLSRLNLDFVFIDTEHIALNREQVAWMCQAYGYAGMAPVVRISSPDPYLACMTLDGGAAGVVAPYIEQVQQVRQLRGAVRYRPLKGARLDTALDDESTLEPALRDYLARHNEASSLIINIESVPAVERLDELLAVPGLDAVLIGPHDLSCSMGIPERYEEPHFEAVVLEIFRRARAQGIGAGIHWWGEVDRLISWADAGANLFIVSGDITAAAGDLDARFRKLRHERGELHQPAAI